MPRAGRREDLLDAAERILAEGGSAALTLDAVAQDASVSKGGLLYHFRTKQDLVRALIDRLVDDTDTQLAEWDDGDVGGFTRGYIESAVAALIGPSSEGILRRWAVILAAGTEPGLQGRLDDAFTKWIQPSPGQDHDLLRAQVARLAADGLWWNAQFVPAFRDEKTVRKIADAIIAYADGHDGDDD